MESVSPQHPLRRLFAGLVEHAFCTEVGVCNPVLTDYMADLLVDFTHIDRLELIRRAEGKRLDQIAAMLALAADMPEPTTSRDRDRVMYRRIGDYTLFWAGVYPEQLKRTCHRPGDLLLDYVAQGKRSYAIAARLADDDVTPPASLLKHLSEDFESCLYGLGVVRRNWENNDLAAGEPGGELLY